MEKIKLWKEKIYKNALVLTGDKSHRSLSLHGSYVLNTDLTDGDLE